MESWLLLRQSVALPPARDYRLFYKEVPRVVARVPFVTSTANAVDFAFWDSAAMRRLLTCLLPFALAAAMTAACAQIHLERIKLPPGFQIEVFAQGVKDARSMALGEKGTLFVSTRAAGNVYAIKHDGRKATQVITIARGLNMPNGVALRDGALFVAEVDKVWA